MKPIYKRSLQHRVCSAKKPECWCRPIVRDYGEYIHFIHRERWTQ